MEATTTKATSSGTIIPLLLIEPRGIKNTGHAGGDRTAANDVWI